MGSTTALLIAAYPAAGICLYFPKLTALANINSVGTFEPCSISLQTRHRMFLAAERSPVWKRVRMTCLKVFTSAGQPSRREISTPLDKKSPGSDDDTVLHPM